VFVTDQHDMGSAPNIGSRSVRVPTSA